MKRKLQNGLIACGIAAFGMLISVSSALALYVKNADDKQIEVSLSTVSYDAELGISDITAANENKLSPAHMSKVYNYKLSAVKGAESSYTQDVVVGKLDITFKTKSANLFDNITVTNVIDYKNYSDPEIVDGKETYFSKTADLNTVVLTGEKVLVGEYYVLTGSIAAPIHVVNGNNVSLTLKLDDTINVDNFIDVATAGYEIEVGLSATADYHFAHVMGLNPGSGLEFSAKDYNQMVPNIYAGNKFEWMWRADKDYPNSTIKCLVNNIWSKEKATADGGDANGNYKVSIVAGDSVYWTGSASAELSFYHPEA